MSTPHPSIRVTAVDGAGLCFAVAGLLWGATTWFILTARYAVEVQDWPVSLPVPMRIVFDHAWLPLAMAFIAPAVEIAVIVSESPQGVRVIAMVTSLLLALVLPALYLLAMGYPLCDMYSGPFPRCLFPSS